MAARTEPWVVQPGDGSAPLIEGTAEYRVCNGTVQARGGGALITTSTGQVVLELPALATWDVSGLDLAKVYAKQAASGGSATLGFIGSVHGGT